MMHATPGPVSLRDITLTLATSQHSLRLTMLSQGFYLPIGFSGMMMGGRGLIVTGGLTVTGIVVEEAEGRGGVFGGVEVWEGGSVFDGDGVWGGGGVFGGDGVWGGGGVFGGDGVWGGGGVFGGDGV